MCKFNELRKPMEIKFSDQHRFYVIWVRLLFKSICNKGYKHIGVIVNNKLSRAVFGTKTQ